MASRDGRRLLPAVQRAVYVALEKYVMLTKRESLLAITKSKREHALDACGVGVYDALAVPVEAAPVAQPALFDARASRAERMTLHWADVVARLRRDRT